MQAAWTFASSRGEQARTCGGGGVLGDVAQQGATRGVAGGSQGGAGQAVQAPAGTAVHGQAAGPLPQHPLLAAHPTMRCSVTLDSEFLAS